MTEIMPFAQRGGSVRIVRFLSASPIERTHTFATFPVVEITSTANGDTYTARRGVLTVPAGDFPRLNEFVPLEGRILRCEILTRISGITGGPVERMDITDPYSTDPHLCYSPCV